LVKARLKSCLPVLALALVLALAALVLGAIAALRGAEYDEQYTLFLTAGVARPVWPDTPFVAGDVRALQAEYASLGRIARDLRATDVHPPLYFWAVALWRRVTGDGLFEARLFSVLCGLAALAAVGAMARRVGVPPALSMLLTLGCYGFAYTGAIARGFALAQALTLWGVAMLLAAEGRRSRMLTAGLLLGAATFANYLAVFVLLTSPAFGGRGRGARATGVRVKVPQTAQCISPHPHPALPVDPRVKRSWACLFRAAMTVYGGALPFLLADLWFFLPQRGSRTGQFPPFHLLHALHLLARYAAANLFGGLPLYVATLAQPAVAAALAVLALACVAVVAVRWRHIAQPDTRALLAAAVAAPPVGLLALGLVFHNTPIELRYLAFATPFAALLLAGALGSLPRHPRHAAVAVLLTMQAAALAGLMMRPETMQPARSTAAAASMLTAGGPMGSIVLLPRGNDGVGVVGAFGIESPASQRLLVVARDEPREKILARIGNASRVVLALLAQDDTSRATLPAMRAAFAGPCWRQVADGFNVVAFDRICEGDAAWHSLTVSR
jgi:Dolichyl-phosphate-mannose-protein mannosyltransferase